jgi:hypothetical protein
MGDEIKLVVQAQRPKDYVIKPFSNDLSLTPFELKFARRPTVRNKAGAVEETFVFVITIFEIGDFTIPSVAVEFTDAEGRLRQANTPAIPVKVVGVAKKPDDKNEIRPIKGPISFKLGFVRALFLGVAAISLSFFLVVKVMLRKRQRFVDPESLKPPHERAILELERLKKKGLLEEARVKEFYSELSDIFRRYLERAYQIESLELTTYEVLKAVQEKDFSRETRDNIRHLLENCDLVKFAKFVPERDFADRLCQKLAETVNLTKPVLIEEEKNRIK